MGRTVTTATPEPRGPNGSNGLPGAATIPDHN